MGGYIKLHRDLFDWEWYSDINTSRLFVHLLLAANFKETRYKGRIIPRGSFVCTLKELEEKTGLSRGELRTALSHLKKTGEISVQTANRDSVFTVNNYDSWQGDEQPDRKNYDSWQSDETPKNCDTNSTQNEHAPQHENDTHPNTQTTQRETALTPHGCGIFRGEEYSPEHENDTQTTQKQQTNDTQTTNKQQSINKPLTRVQNKKEKNIKKDKNIKKEREKEKDAAASSRPEQRTERRTYGEYGWVRLTDDEYSRLTEEYGGQRVTAAVRYVDESAQRTGNKNRWRDWNLVLRKAIRENWGNISAPPRERSYDIDELERKIQEQYRR